MKKIILITLALISTFSSPSFACSLGRVVFQTPFKLMDDAHVSFVGTIISKTLVDDDHIDIKVRVEKVFKGNLPKTLTYKTGTGGSMACNFAGTLGETYLFSQSKEEFSHRGLSLFWNKAQRFGIDGAKDIHKALSKNTFSSQLTFSITGKSKLWVKLTGPKRITQATEDFMDKRTGCMKSIEWDSGTLGFIIEWGDGSVEYKKFNPSYLNPAEFKKNYCIEPLSHRYKKPGNYKIHVSTFEKDKRVGGRGRFNSRVFKWYANKEIVVGEK